MNKVMAKFYLTRHGQTALNSVGRLQGRMDSPLTEHGRTQARRVAEKLAAIINTNPVQLSVSPLGRAQETASILKQHLNVAAIESDERLAEIGIGNWEGMTMEDIEFTHPSALDGSGRFDWAYRAPGGEPKAAFLSRLTEWLADVESARMTIVAVSHGWSGMGIRSLYAAEPFERVTAKGDSHEAVFEFFDGRVREF